MADGAVLRKLLGRPSKTKTLSSCMTGISKDLKLTYANIFVQLGKEDNWRRNRIWCSGTIKYQERISMRKFTKTMAAVLSLTMTLTMVTPVFAEGETNITPAQTTEVVTPTPTPAQPPRNDCL